MWSIKRLLGRETGPELPSYEDRYTLNQLQKFEALLQDHGRSLRDFRSVLEFGCGFGRLLKHMTHLMPQASFSGCDVIEAAVQHCRKQWPHGQFRQGDAFPPCDFAAGQFDLIYSYSVFTHLSEDNHIAWLGELARLLKPGGVMLHSTKSYEYVRRASFFSPEWLRKYEVDPPFAEFESRHPYHYIVDNSALPEYGITLISKDYVIANWSAYAGMAVADYREGFVEAHPEGCHDLVLLMDVG
jgi:SAM-dependent methyltransferase